jgi:hypothetical protein
MTDGFGLDTAVFGPKCYGPKDRFALRFVVQIVPAAFPADEFGGWSSPSRELFGGFAGCQCVVRTVHQ